MSGEIIAAVSLTSLLMKALAGTAATGAAAYAAARQKRQEEAARREEQQRREQEAQLERQRAEKAERLRREQVSAALASARQSLSAVRATSSQSAQQVAAVQTEIDALSRGKDVSAERARQLASRARAVAQKVAQAEQAEEARLKQEARLATDALRIELDAALSGEEAQFAAKEMEDVVRTAQQIEQAANGPEFRRVAGMCNSASKSLQSAVSLAASRARQFEAASRAAAKAVGELKVRVAGHDIPLESDKPSVRWWMQSEFEAVKKTAEQAESSLAVAGSTLDQALLEKVQKTCAANLDSLAKMEARLGGYLEKYAKRDAIAKFVADSLIDMGYQYSVAFTEPSDPKSAVLFTGRDHMGQSIVTSVDLDGNIKAKFADFREWSGCDKEAERFRQLIAGREGVASLEGVRFVPDTRPSEDQARKAPARTEPRQKKTVAKHVQQGR
ncbi:MAG: hypothetical protein HY673_17370 [Chloroflexi bacterium]|nr:hypothetical protein [Chloroflexota bacterium]